MDTQEDKKPAKKIVETTEKETPCLTCGENKVLTKDKINKIIEDRREIFSKGSVINK